MKYRLKNNNTKGFPQTRMLEFKIHMHYIFTDFVACYVHRQIVKMTGTILFLNLDSFSTLEEADFNQTQQKLYFRCCFL